jgi:hypothetical protein
MDSPTTNSTGRLRLERLALLARHDSGALSPAVFQVVRDLEIAIAWREHATATRTEGGVR